VEFVEFVEFVDFVDFCEDSVLTTVKMTQVLNCGEPLKYEGRSWRMWNSPLFRGCSRRAPSLMYVIRQHFPTSKTGCEMRLGFYVLPSLNDPKLQNMAKELVLS
jgi:hypothetical protein